MTKLITGILICTLFFCGKVTWAEESSERLKDISKAVSNQLLRIKQDEAGKDPQVVIKKTPEKSKSKQTSAKATKATKETESKIPNEALPSEDKVTLSKNKLLEKGSKVLAEDKSKKATTKSVKLTAKQVPATNLQLNNMLRQQIENIVDTTPE